MIEKIFKTLSLFIIFIVTCNAAMAQISGAVIDAETGDSIPLATVSYKGHRITTVANKKGVFTISRHDGWKLTVSAVGYKTKSVALNASGSMKHFDILLKPDNHQLGEVVVKSKKSKYSRKENPAVTLMRKVIAHKKETNLKNKDFYRYTKYDKMKLAFNDMNREKLEKKGITNKDWIKNQLEVCPLNNKLILPIQMKEMVTEELYRKSSDTEKTIVKGEKSQGISELFQSGDIANIMMADVFSPVNIYDDQIRLMRQHFTSPIGKDAIAFYRFYIEDTLKIDRDSVIQLTFMPNNLQDIGFRGELYVVKDSTYRVKKIRLGLPFDTGVNWVDRLDVIQEYQQVGLGKGDWVLASNTMLIEVSVLEDFGQMAVINTSHYSDYSFASIPDKDFRGAGRERVESGAEYRDEAFWTQHRANDILTEGENHTTSFIDGIKNMGGNTGMFLLRMFVENFIETSKVGNPNYFDIGPVNTIFSHNNVDGMRFRLGGQTTANLNRHLFLKGYVARGFNTKKNYYDAILTYSFKPRKYLPQEFPRHYMSIESTYDICSASDRFTGLDKDNMFAVLKWSDTRRMHFYDRQKFTYVFERANGFKVETSLKREENEATGDLLYRPLSQYGGLYDGKSWDHYFTYDPDALHNGKLSTTEAAIGIEYSPGVKYVSSKRGQKRVNKEGVVLGLTHTVGLSGFLGGQYKYHITEASVKNRFFLNSWGILDFTLKGGVQWSQVPYPLLMSPATNLSYFTSRETFCLIDESEFMNDRYASATFSWRVNGKLFNRIPLLRRLKWREYVAFKTLWGDLSSKNDPSLPKNWNSDVLMAFPNGCYAMNPHKPYMEVEFGIRNILHIFGIDYVRRLNYLDHAKQKGGLRFIADFTF